MLILMHKLLFVLSPLPPARPFQRERSEGKRRAWLVLILIFEKLVPFLSANEKWKKWNTFLYLFREKNYLTLYQFELLTP